MLLQVGKQCAEDLAREIFMRQGRSLTDLEVRVLLLDIKINTSPTEVQIVRVEGRA